MTGYDTAAMQFELFVAALAAFEDEMQALAPFFLRFSAGFMAGTSPSVRRRMERDLARANRRPSLIHRGGKA